MVTSEVFHLTRAGCAWRDLPPWYRNWKTVYNRHRQSRCAPLSSRETASHSCRSFMIAVDVWSPDGPDAQSAAEPHWISLWNDLPSMLGSGFQFFQQLRDLFGLRMP